MPQKTFKSPKFSVDRCNHVICLFTSTNYFPSKHDTLNQCWFNVGPMSQSASQHWSTLVPQISFAGLASGRQYCFGDAVYVHGSALIVITSHVSHLTSICHAVPLFLLLWGLSDPRIAELRDMPRSLSIKLHSETQVSGHLGMSEGRFLRHAQNPLPVERRRTLAKSLEHVKGQERHDRKAAF